MFEEFVDKKVKVYLNDDPSVTYVLDGKLIKSSEYVTIIEVEEKKKFGESKVFQRAINNRYITYIDLVV